MTDHFGANEEDEFLLEEEEETVGAHANEDSSEEGLR